MTATTHRRRRRATTSGEGAEEPITGDRSFEPREGDRLLIHYAGAKLQIEPFNNVELDGATYSRTLQPGDDPDVEYDRIYRWLRDKSLAEAREKLRTFAEELREARKLSKD